MPGKNSPAGGWKCTPFGAGIRKSRPEAAKRLGGSPCPLRNAGGPRELPRGVLQEQSTTEGGRGLAEPVGDQPVEVEAAQMRPARQRFAVEIRVERVENGVHELAQTVGRHP